MKNVFRPTACFLLVWAICVLMAGAVQVEASYYLNGQRSTVGVYGYGDEYMKSSGIPVKGHQAPGDEEKQFLTFADGALMDADGDDLRQSVCFGANRYDVQVQSIFMDLGQPVVLDALDVKSNLLEWWIVTYFQAAFSLDGKTFANTVSHNGGGRDKVPHAGGLAVACNLPVRGVNARFIRLRFHVGPWDNLQVGELDIKAHTPVTKPLTRMEMEPLKELVWNNTQTPAVDQFGQWKRDDWQGKVHTEEELVRMHQADDKRYANVEMDLQKFDKFGGDKSLGITVRANGRWRLEKIAGRWWFITPEGNPFIMIGVDGASTWGVSAIEHPGKPNLSKLYEWMPPKDGRFADGWRSSDPANGIWRFFFFAANLQRVYGDKDLWQKFYNTAQRRFIDWGFNCMGKFSDVVHNQWLEIIGRPMPYIMDVIPIPDPGVQLVPYAHFHDPWDPNYPKSVENAIKHARSEYGGDTYFIGLMFYREGWWDGGVTAIVLKSVPATPAKQAFVEELKNTYGNIATLNAKCGTQWKSYHDLLEIDLNPYIEKITSDISRFIEIASARYYGTWREMADKYYPGLLLLGACFDARGSWAVGPEWIKGSVKSCDALCTDWYGKDAAEMLQYYVEKYAVPDDKPVLIGEIGFTTPNYGFTSGKGQCENQDERGRWYRYVYETLYAHPNWVGTNYFIYRDQDMIGRDPDGSGESWQYGLVNICDLPYEEFIAHVRKTNARLAAIHAGKLKPSTKIDLELK